MSSSKAPPPTTTTTTTTTTESPKHLEMEKEMEQSSTEKPSMHDHMDHNSITSTSAELRELSVSPSAIESKGGDEEEDELNDISHQHDDPNQHLRNSLAEASARGPFHPQDDGLLWTFGILIAVLVILTVIILIPILIIRKSPPTFSNHDSSPHSLSTLSLHRPSISFKPNEYIQEAEQAYEHLEQQWRSAIDEFIADREMRNPLWSMVSVYRSSCGFII